jgi:hypothetical protein
MRGMVDQCVIPIEKYSTISPITMGWTPPHLIGIDVSN